jgi:hypothetical protein
MAASPALPIRRVAFFKHGVALVAREGTVDGDRLSLPLRDDDVDDALKSLTIVAQGGGRVACVDYELSGRGSDGRNPMAVAAGRGLLDLLDGLTGRPVTVRTAAHDAPLQGRVVGLQYAGSKPRVAGARLALLDEASGAVRVVPLESIVEVTPLSGRSGDDLRRHLDAASRTDGTRDVTVRLAQAAGALDVSYLVPAPAWRVSYRVVAEPDPADPSGRGGRLLLQGWGLVDNRFGEDLENVHLQLVAGQPISFVYDLATAHVPERARVADRSREATGPVEFEASERHHAASESSPSMSMASYCMDADEPEVESVARSMSRRRERAAAAAASIDALIEAAPRATTDDRGETFAYEVVDPVTIPRGASALVPVLQAVLPYRRELLYDHARLADHPVAALRCTNGRELVLERGPVTVLERGSYRGEAIVPFTGKGGELHLPYAVELGVTVTVDQASTREVTGLRIEGALLHVEHAIERRHAWRIVNRTEAEQLVTLEIAAHELPGPLLDTRAPDARTERTLRWDVACPPGAPTEFVARSRHVFAIEQTLARLGLDTLAEHLATRGLDETTRARLAALRDVQQAIDANDARRRELGRQREALAARQEERRRNIAALGTAGDEGAVRLRMVHELQATEERIAALLAEIDRLQADTETRRRERDEAGAEA